MGRRREKFSGDLLNLMERRGRKNISLELYFIPGLWLACVQTPLPFPLRKNRLLLQVNAEFIFDSECLSANSGDKGLFKPEDNLQIADVRRVVISSCCSCYVFSKYFAYFRGTQRQFSENICSEYDLRSRIFGTFVVKFFACLPLLAFENI